MLLVLFEDSARQTMLPLTHVQAAFDLRCGIFTAWERAARIFPAATRAMIARPELASVLTERHGAAVNIVPDGPACFVNGSALLRKEHVALIKAGADRDTCFKAGGRAVAYTRASRESARAMHDALVSGNDVPGGSEVTFELPGATTVARPWDLIARNAQMIEADASVFPLGTMNGTAVVAQSARLVSPERLHIGAGARVGEGVVLDASEGPVIIDAGAQVMHQATVTGPVYVGEASRVKIGAKIYHGTSAGPQCKLGGEIEESVFHSFSNKQHDGFVGHSYIASWANLGADTNTSDLKNNYGEVRATLEGIEHATGTMFLGTIMADHAKCGINTMFNTGTVIGVGSNVFGGGYPPKFIPSFAWGGAEGLTEFDFEKCAAVAGAVMARRGRTLTHHERDLLRRVFEHTAGQR